MHCIIDLMPGTDQNEVEAILRTCIVSDSNALCAALQMKCRSLNLFISHLFDNGAEASGNYLSF